MRLPKSLTKVAVLAAVCSVAMGIASVCGAADAPSKPSLKFDADGFFKIVMFSDVQDDLPFDERTTDAMNRILDVEKPDFVILAGDNITKGIKTADDFKEYVKIMVTPMEKRSIPWAHVYGNHDEDHTKETGLTRALQQPIYEAYPFCLSQAGPAGIGGHGNFVLPVMASAKENVTFAIWGLDNGNYLSDNNAWYGGDMKKDVILDKMLQGNFDYDFLKFGQLSWYWNTSMEMEKTAGHKVAGVMFMHMPLPEHRLITMNPTKTGMVGEKNEEECNPAINSGMFAAILQRADVKGVFVGHDHVNDYVGTYCGIKLGYDANVGYATYGLDGAERDRLRGARVIRINERNPFAIETWMRYHSECK